MAVPRFVFDLGALPYDRMTRHPHWKAHCASLVDHFPAVHGRPRRVLDLGCGPGVSALAFHAVSPGDAIVGLDIAAPMVRRAVRHDRDRVCGWIRGDAHHLPLADASYDVVTGHSFLYLVPDRARALAEIHRVLRPGGRLVLLEPRHQGAVADAASVWRCLWDVDAHFAFTMAAWRVVAAGSGAFRPGELERLFGEAGLRDPELDTSLEGMGWVARAGR